MQLGPPAASSNTWIQYLVSINEPKPSPPEVVERWMAVGGTNAADFLAPRQAGGGQNHLRAALVERFNARRSTLEEDAKLMKLWMRGASESKVMSHFDLSKLYQENEAFRWMRQQIRAQ